MNDTSSTGLPNSAATSASVNSPRRYPQTREASADCVGKKYGRLTVMALAGKDTSSQLLVQCQCECGKFIVTRLMPVKRGSPSSCGCLHKKPEDAVGQVFNRLRVLSVRRAKPHAFARCVCACGVPVETTLASLRSGNTKSCGCLQREVVSALCKEKNKTHGMTNTVEHHVWTGAIQRVTNPNNASYKSYSKLGMASEFLNSFEAWHKELGPKPPGRWYMDRRDPDIGYFPGNLRWVSMKTSSRNRRCVRQVLLNGQQMLLVDAARQLGVGRGLLRHRYVTSGYDLHFEGHHLVPAPAYDPDLA